MTKENIIYSAVKLIPCIGLGRLKEIASGRPVVYCDHMTLGFGDNVTNSHMSNVGKLVGLHVTKYIYSKNVGCVVVRETTARIWDCQSLFPHITLWSNEGVSPAESNNLLKNFYEGDNEIVAIDLDLPPIYGHVNLFVKTPDGKGKWLLG